MNKSVNLALSLLLFILLTSCAPKPQLSKTIPPAPAITIESELTAQTKQLTESQTETLKDYIERSESNSGPLRQQYILEMSEWLYEQLELKAALRALEKLQPEQLSLQQNNRAFLLKARIMLSLGDNISVIRTLPVTLDNLSNQQKIDVLNLRAQAYLGADYPFEAIRTRIMLSAYLQNELEIDDNRYTIWRILNLMSLNSLKQINTLELGTQLKGWIELAITTKNNQNNWQQLENIYRDWLQNHPQHPAGRTFLATLAQKQVELIKQPRHIALLLPLNDKFAGPARAIRDGFLSTHFQAQRQRQIQISVIDTSESETSIWQHYQTALQKGADFIVGPLAKKSIDELAKIKELDVPVLTLNYAEQQSSATDNLFQFGLLPEDEATQIAELAIKQGKKHAAILVPASPWGERLQNAFRQRFEELGGEARSIKTYQSKRNDFSNSITTLLNLTQSKQRIDTIKNLLGNNIKYELYRRNDIDMIFIAGEPRAARSILPQLKFHQASDLQVYSTSHAYTGSPNKSADRDINQLLYCDIPWVLEDNTIKTTVEKNWPDSSKHYSRLYALGADAYHLIPYLGRLKARSGENFNGYTGNLYLDPLLRIHRKLITAQFIEGLPVPLAAQDNMSILYQNQEAPQDDNPEQVIN
ncbi:MAG: penicillin-binding protein activator [Gammaproteobacteria bacterium]|nr:penicillin-binding protein activator [Gammaproteobacteria bacterium]